MLHVELHTVCKKYTLCVKLHTAKLHRSTRGPFVGTFRVNCQKIPLTWKNFPQTLFAAFVTNIRYAYAYACIEVYYFGTSYFCESYFILLWSILTPVHAILVGHTFLYRGVLPLECLIYGEDTLAIKFCNIFLSK